MPESLAHPLHRRRQPEAAARLPYTYQEIEYAANFFEHNSSEYIHPISEMFRHWQRTWDTTALRGTSIASVVENFRGLVSRQLQEGSSVSHAASAGAHTTTGAGTEPQAGVTSGAGPGSRDQPLVLSDSSDDDDTFCNPNDGWVRYQPNKRAKAHTERCHQKQDETEEEPEQQRQAPANNSFTGFSDSRTTAFDRQRRPYASTFGRRRSASPEPQIRAGRATESSTVGGGSSSNSAQTYRQRSPPASRYSGQADTRSFSYGQRAPDHDPAAVRRRGARSSATRNRPLPRNMYVTGTVVWVGWYEPQVRQLHASEKLEGTDYRVVVCASFSSNGSFHFRLRNDNMAALCYQWHDLPVPDGYVTTVPGRYRPRTSSNACVFPQVILHAALRGLSFESLRLEVARISGLPPAQRIAHP